MKNILIVIVVIIVIALVFYWYECETGESQIKTKIGEEFTIVLDANPTTGYQWQVDFDKNYLELVDREYEVDRPELMGSGGKETFEFKAKKAGETEIKFGYLRPWESVQPLQEKVYKIKIK